MNSTTLKITIALSIIILFAACQVDQEDKVDQEDQSGNGFESYDLLAMDSHWFADGTFAALYIDLNSVDGQNPGILVHVDKNNNVIWKADEDLNLRFPHTIFPVENGYLISDSSNQRIIQIDNNNDITWEMDPMEIGIGEDGECFFPNDADVTNDGTVIISNNCDGSIYEFTFSGEPVWEFNVSNLILDGQDNIPDNKNPEVHDPDKLDNGNILFCASTYNSVIEINPQGEIIWQYNQSLKWPRNADRLENGNTLITDNDKSVEVNPEGNVVWSYDELSLGAYNAERLEDGTTLITTSGDLLIRVDQNEEVIWTFSLSGNTTPTSTNTHPLMQPHGRYILQTLGYLR